MAETKTQPRKFRIWPGIVAPLGLSLITALAVWLFQGKVTADQARADAENVRRETAERQEAGEIARHSQTLAAAFVDAKSAARSNQEKNLNLEAKGILDTLYRHMTVALDKVRKNASARREVRPFPPGFEGIRGFLEIAPSADKQDEALEALRASHTELSSLLPAGCSFAVIEDNSRQLFSLGGGVPPENAVTASVTRDFIFNDGGTSRQWSIRLDVVSADQHPKPDAVSTAGYIAENLRTARLGDVAWQGWLLGRNGTVEAAFGPDLGPNGTAQELPPYIDVAGEWVDVDGKRLIWLEKSGLRPNLDWETAIAVAMPRPGPPLDVVEEFMADGRWSLTIGFLTIAALAGWVLFVRSMFAASRTADAVRPGSQALSSSVRSVAPPERPRRRLVRDESVVRSASADDRELIVADIGDDGTVRVQEQRYAGGTRFFEKPEMTSGSLYRLQAVHRGRDGGMGSRVLDQAKTPVLKELAKRVRPQGNAPVRRAAPVGAKPEVLPSMKSPAGWKKVDPGK